MKDYITNVIAPKVQGDGGWIEFVSYENHELSVILRGECSKCQMAERCMNWVTEQVHEDLGETITIRAQKIKPFFWRV